MLNKDMTRFGWGVVALILVVDGVRHAVTGQLWGRVRLAESVPVSEGWHVVAIGIAEAAFGLYLAYRMFRKK